METLMEIFSLQTWWRTLNQDLIVMLSVLNSSLYQGEIGCFDVFFCMNHSYGIECVFKSKEHYLLSSDH